MGQYVIGIDLGGTKVLAVAVNEKGEIVARAKQKTEVGSGVALIGRQMKEAAEEALAELKAGWDDVKRIGVAIPASVDSATGDALHAPALGWKNEPVRETLEEIFGRSINLENDVNCGVLGEYHGGAGKGHESVAGYFVGTGLGGGLILDGKLWHGRCNVAGEFGHEIVRAKGRRCGCGKRGCVEAYCSKTAFSKKFRKLIDKKGRSSVLTDLMDGDFNKRLKSKTLAKAYRQGDKVTVKVVDKGMEMLGIAASNLMAVVAPDCIILGGGVMEALGPELLPVVRDSLDRHLFGITPKDVTLKLSALGDDAVPLGAALLGDNAGGTAGASRD